MLKLPWRTLQVLINLGTVISGLCTVMPISYIRRYFTGLCILYADVRLSSANGSAPSLTVDMVRSVWGSSRSCDFPTYTPVVAGIHAFIWCWYFVLMKKQLKKEHKEFPLLAMSLVTHGIMLVPVFVASCMISAGGDSWCYDLRREVNKYVTDRQVSCRDTQRYNWTNIYQTQTHHIQDFLLTSRISSWIQSVSLIAQVLVSGYVMYKWILNTTDRKNVNINNKHRHKHRHKAEKRLGNGEDKTMPNGKKGAGLHVPEIHITVPDIHMHRHHLHSSYQRLDDDNNSSSSNDGPVAV